MKHAIKSFGRGIFLVLAFPLAFLSGFGRVHGAYLFFAHLCSLIPGVLGDYLRIAFYRQTLTHCGASSRVSFGSFFPHPHVSIGERVYIGPYCVLGRCRIGDRTQIATQVQILSGRRQHARDESGSIGTADLGNFEAVSIGADCWIGAAAIVMANVGDGSTVGAGAIVVKEIPGRSVAVGNPARVVRENVE